MSPYENKKVEEIIYMLTRNYISSCWTNIFLFVIIIILLVGG